MVSKIAHFITTDIWRFRLSDLPKSKSLLLKPLRIIVLALRGFGEDQCKLRASALTFYSLLSVVPVVAMAFGIAKGFGFDKMLEEQLMAKVPGQEEVLMKVIVFARNLLENTRGGMIAGIGVAILFWTVIKVLGNIEKSFNDIWGIKESRSLARKFSDYLSIMLICPILAIVSSSVTIFITTQINLIMEKVALLGYVAPLISLGLKTLPYVMIWLLFSFIYVFMPNTKVKVKSGIIAGIIAGTVFQIVQFAYITFQVGVAKYNAIYGSFAALPLFLIWLQISWLIVLFGAEISFATQNVDTYEFEPDCMKVSDSFKRRLTLEVMHLLVRRFVEAREPLTASEISHILEIPVRLLRQILFELAEAGLASEIHTDKYEEVAFQPARDVDDMTVKSVIDALEHHGTEDLPVAETEELKKITETLKIFGNTVTDLPENRLLKEI